MYLAADEAARGWGGPIALGVAVAIFVAIVTVADYIGERRNSSPTPRGRPRAGVNAQVKSVSDTDDTDRDTSPWWGRIIDLDGRRVRRVAHIVRTGSSLPVDDDIDLALDEDQADETLEEFVDRRDRENVAYAEIVREAMRQYRVSEATAKRRIRDARRDAI